ncbi:PREDICTED: uncharacterized protein LOC103327695 [Prunus mume]|uniref:Uncharacterized protein LOC103327695 n=1 Tax=Prunus mume TaxID=102107 RepID=A0ABM0NQG1_PRUMU|nr:PREDICTED: uncharacterized protein LOC103327695 [Prunus mume]
MEPRPTFSTTKRRLKIDYAPFYLIQLAQSEAGVEIELSICRCVCNGGFAEVLGFGNKRQTERKENVSFDRWKIDNPACVLQSDDNNKNKNFSNAMPFDSVQFHASSLSFFKAVATRIELSSTPPQRHCFCLPYLQAPRPSHLLRR